MLDLYRFTYPHAGENLLTLSAYCGTIIQVIIISFLMRETLHTISPLTNPMDQMRSRRGIAIGLILVGLLIVAAAVGYYFYRKHVAETISNRVLTTEEKNAIISEMNKLGGPTLTPAQKESVIEAQSKVVADTKTLSAEEKSDIIKQMNSR